MPTQIETFYQKRKKYRGAHIGGLIIFFLAWISRSIYKISQQNLEYLHSGIFLILMLSLVFLAYYAVRVNILEHQIKKDSTLREALHDELFRLNELKSWKVAYFAVIGFVVLVAILSLFIVFKDLMLIFITTLLIGFGSYSLSLYILDR